MDRSRCRNASRAAAESLIIHRQSSPDSAPVSPGALLLPEGGAVGARVPRPSTAASGKRSVAGAVVASTPARGSCLSLWKRSDLRAELWRVHQSPPRRPPAYPAIRPVRLGQLDGLQHELAIERIDARHAGRFVGVPTEHRVDPLQDAWCAMVQDHMSGEGDCFFTGSYSDGYGYPHGLMKSHNVIKDFERFLVANELDLANWVCAVELHKYRDILHLHALISAVGEFADRVKLERSWRASGRGLQVTAEPLEDQGVSYCTKYALKGQNAADFEWSWTA